MIKCILKLFSWCLLLSSIHRISNMTNKNKYITLCSKIKADYVHTSIAPTPSPIPPCTGFH